MAICSLTHRVMVLVWQLHNAWNRKGHKAPKWAMAVVFDKIKWHLKDEHELCASASVPVYMETNFIPLSYFISSFGKSALRGDTLKNCQHLSAARVSSKPQTIDVFYMIKTLTAQWKFESSKQIQIKIVTTGCVGYTAICNVILLHTSACYNMPQRWDKLY